MRKLISLGVLAILLSMLANTVFAGNVEECEVLKDSASPGLYGLCIAYHNAGSSNAMDRILNNYNKKAGPGDPPMPGTEESVPCPCWSTDDLAGATDIGSPTSCLINEEGTGIEFAIYGGGVLQFFVNDISCFQINPDPLKSVLLPTENAESNQACRDGIHALVEMDFGDSCL